MRNETFTAEYSHYPAATAVTSAARAADSVALPQNAARASIVAIDAAVEAWRAAEPRAAQASVGAMTDQVRADMVLWERSKVFDFYLVPLWAGDRPQWAARAWADLKICLPEDQDWDVWIDWYEERLRGGSRGKEYEFVFANVPQEEWDRGPAAANAWIKTHLPKPKEGDTKDLAEGDSLKQQAALYAFQLADGRIAVAPEEAKPEDREATKDFLDELRRKAAEQRERLMRVQADARLQRTLALLDQRLAPPLEQICIGLVLSSLRSLESDVRAYDTEEGRREHAPDLISGLDDLAGTVHDFASQFPRSREILANQFALDLVEEPRALDAAAEASESVAAAAEAHPELVSGDSPDVLREPKEFVEGARTIADRAKFVGLRLLTVLNFGRIVAQAREIAVDAGGELRKQAPKAAAGVGDGRGEPRNRPLARRKRPQTVVGDWWRDRRDQPGGRTPRRRLRSLIEDL